MKSRLYYLLVLCYIFVVGIILYVNGVFTGNIPDRANLVINLTFLLIIGVIFCISIVSFVKVNNLASVLEMATADIERNYTEKRKNLWEEYSAKKKIFGDPDIDEPFGRYLKKMRNYKTKYGVTQVIDLEEYINEELIDQVGMTYFNSTVAGTMTGLGILGTFLGLALGLGSFDGTDIYTISDNIGPLLAGMKVAFHTSVYGIFFSLIFTYVHRCVMSCAYEKLEVFLDTYKECVEPPITTSDENMKAMLLYQANLANSMKELTLLMKGQADTQIKGVEQIVDQFVIRMESALATDFTKLGNTLTKAGQDQRLYAENFKSMEQTTLALIKANSDLQKVLESTMDRQERLEKELRNQQDRVEETCNKINDEISNQLFTLNRMQ